MAGKAKSGKPAARKPAGRTGTTQRARASNRRTVDWAPAFLTAYADSGIIGAACEAAGIGRSTFYARRAADAAFRDALAVAAEQAADALEAEARRRALHGVAEPIIGRVGKDQDGWLRDVDPETGEIVQLVLRRYSDPLIMFLLKGLRPEKYRERYEVRHLSPETIDEELRKLAAEIEARGGEVPTE